MPALKAGITNTDFFKIGYANADLFKLGFWMSVLLPIFVEVAL